MCWFRSEIHAESLELLGIGAFRPPSMLEPVDEEADPCQLQWIELCLNWSPRVVSIISQIGEIFFLREMGAAVVPTQNGEAMLSTAVVTCPDLEVTMDQSPKGRHARSLQTHSWEESA